MLSTWRFHFKSFYIYIFNEIFWNKLFFDNQQIKFVEYQNIDLCFIGVEMK